MRTWRKLPGEHLDLYCPIGLRLIDSLTGREPMGWIRATLDVSDGAGGWLVTGVKPVVTLSGILVYPGLSHRQIAGALRLSLGVVNKYLHAAQATGITWPPPDGLIETQLQRRLFPPDASPSPPHYGPVDFAAIHQELKRKGVTKQL